MNELKTKKFKVTFEIESIPYNKETFEQLGPCFMEEYDEETFAREDVSELIRMLSFANLKIYLMMQNQDPEFYEMKNVRMNKLIDEISQTVEVKSI
jgi:hypothetical protein